MILILVSHKKIIEYCNRPFKTIEEMNKKIIKNWNSIVNKRDQVWHLGDFGFGNQEQISQIVSQLNGNIFLIKGNHDNHSNQWYKDCGIKKIYDYPIIIQGFLVLSHEPQPFICDSRTPYVNFFGHLHDSQMIETYGKRHFCACVERHDYRPVNIQEVIEFFQREE